MNLAIRSRGGVSKAAIVSFLLGGLTVACIVSSSDAVHASTTVCAGAIRDEACKKVSTAVPSKGPVLFSLSCYGGGLAPPDAAPMYSDVGVDLAHLRLESEGMKLPGTFERLDRTCDDGVARGLWSEDGQLFRYTGPLKPGAQHLILYPHTYSSRAMIRFDVAMATSDAGMGVNTGGGSCVCGGANARGAGLGVAWLIFALRFRRRPRR